MSAFDRDYMQTLREHLHKELDRQDRLQEELDRQVRNQRNAGLVLLGVAMLAFWAWFWWSLGA